MTAPEPPSPTCVRPPSPIPHLDHLFVLLHDAFVLAPLSSVFFLTPCTPLHLWSCVRFRTGGAEGVLLAVAVTFNDLLSKTIEVQGFSHQNRQKAQSCHEQMPTKPIFMSECCSCTDHSSKERRRPLFCRPFWTVTQPVPCLLVPLSGILAPRQREQRKNGEKTSQNGRDMAD